MLLWVMGEKLIKEAGGTLKGWAVDNQEETTTRIKLGSETVFLGAIFNLLTLTALIRLGWELQTRK